MELHPYLENHICPNFGLWYVLNIVGDDRYKWVGPSACFVPSKNSGELFHLSLLFKRYVSMDIYHFEIIFCSIISN